MKTQWTMQDADGKFLPGPDVYGPHTKQEAIDIWNAHEFCREKGIAADAKLVIPRDNAPFPEMPFLMLDVESDDEYIVQEAIRMEEAIHRRVMVKVRRHLRQTGE